MPINLASSPASAGAYNQPVRPVSITSHTCPTRAATTGKAMAMYSNNLTGEKYSSASAAYVTTVTSIARSRSGTV